MSIKSLTLLACLFFTFTVDATTKHKYTIMIDPAGDAKQTGRTINDSLERAITLNLAEALQQELTKLAHYTVILTRTPGEVVPPLQNANFSNRLPIDLYISLHCYSNPKEKLSLDLYQFSYHEMISPHSHDLAMIPYDKAHVKTYDTTQRYAQNIKTALINAMPLFQIRGIYAIPFYPLIGIQAAAIGIEMNCIQPTDWQTYIKPLAESIVYALETT